jgi:hypothetical protein
MHMLHRKNHNRRGVQNKPQFFVCAHCITCFSFQVFTPTPSMDKSPPPCTLHSGTRRHEPRWDLWLRLAPSSGPLPARPHEGEEAFNEPGISSLPALCMSSDEMAWSMLLSADDNPERQRQRRCSGKGPTMLLLRACPGLQDHALLL